jgi:hypothetical protein
MAKSNGINKVIFNPMEDLLNSENFNNIKYKKTLFEVA